MVSPIKEHFPKMADAVEQKDVAQQHDKHTHSPESSKQQFVRVLQAPDEILLKIALNLGTDTTAIRNLALTHRRFRSVTHEALVRSGVVPLRSIHKYIVLLSRNPEWKPLITRIEFKDGSRRYDEVKPRQAAIDAGLKMLHRILPHHVLEEMEQVFLSRTTWPETWSLLLLASLPNLNVLALNPKSYPFPPAYRSILEYSFESHFDHESLFGHLRQILKHRVKELDIRTEDPDSRYMSDAVANASKFTDLKVLSLPGDYIRLLARDVEESPRQHPSWKFLGDPHRILPHNFETLRIYCDQETCPWEWLQELECMMHEDYGVPCLCHIQLLFSLPCRAVAHYAVCSVESTQRFKDSEVLHLLQARTEKRVVVETLFLQHGTQELPSMDQRRYKAECLTDAIRSVQEETGRSIYFGS